MLDERTPDNEPKVTKAMFRQPHFWLWFASCVISAVIASGGIPEGRIHQGLITIATLLGFLGYQAGARWQPPRIEWTEEERHQYYVEQVAKRRPPGDVQR